MGEIAHMKDWRLQIGMGERADSVWDLQSLSVSELPCICHFCLARMAENGAGIGVMPAGLFRLALLDSFHALKTLGCRALSPMSGEFCRLGAAAAKGGVRHGEDCPVPEEATDARLPAFHREGASVRDDFLDGICEGPGTPGRLMRLAGLLGSGRTTFLGDLARIAGDEGWQAIKIYGTGLLRNAVDGLAALSEGLDDGCLPDGLRLRHLLERTAADLNGGGRGLVLLVDDTQKAKKDELALLAECVPYEIRKRHDRAARPCRDTREHACMYRWRWHGLSFVCEGRRSACDS